MTKQDLIQRFIFENMPIRGEWARLTESYQTIMQQHQYPPLLKQILGEMLVSAALLSAIIKFDGRLTIQFQGNSKLKLLLAQCDSQFHIRGVAQWDSEIQPDELLQLLKEGVMVITIEPEQGQRYQGIVAWQGESLAESIEGYFRSSEQLPTRIWISVDENSVTGLLLQAMPEEKISQDNHDWEHVIHLTDTVTDKELATLTPDILLHRLYVEEQVRIFEPVPVAFRCRCSVARCEGALLIAGREEVEQELQGKQHIVVTCEFCSKEYSFDRIDIERIFSKGAAPPTSTQLH
jgi:molecular chaperone Hsp33